MDRADACDRDFYLWTQEQASALRRAGEARVNAPVDWENVADEIESMGRSQRSEVVTHLTVLIAHVLKWQHCPELRDRNERGWRLTIREQRRRNLGELEDGPSLRSFASAVFLRAYSNAVPEAADQAEVELFRFPAEPQFTIDDALDPGFPRDLFEGQG